MFRLMYNDGGIGLAATQIGWDAQVIVINLSGEPARKEDEFILINPNIVTESDKFVSYREGCLSCPGFTRDVLRPDMIGVAYIDINMNERFGSFDGLMARVIQHEIDHLKGVTIKDI